MVYVYKERGGRERERERKRKRKERERIYIHISKSKPQSQPPLKNNPQTTNHPTIKHPNKCTFHFHFHAQAPPSHPDLSTNPLLSHLTPPPPHPHHTPQDYPPVQQSRSASSLRFLCLCSSCCLCFGGEYVEDGDGRGMGRVR